MTGRSFCIANAQEKKLSCKEGFEGVSAEEIRDWADKGWKSGGSSVTFDSHIHVWGDGTQPYPYDNDPPDVLRKICDAEKFVANAKNAQVSGALIVQPINYRFDHSYVASVIARYPKFFTGMALADPAVEPVKAESYLRNLKKDGFVALRFNPYLWNGSMADESGKAIYAKAGELGMPVGVMCFKGLPQHMPDIKSLLEHSSDTKLIVDHWGFFRQPATGGTDPKTSVSEDAWNDLLSLSKYPQVYVKISALFRVSGEQEPYSDLKPRLDDLLKHFGPSRLMWGSDYPFAIVNGGYCASVQTLRSWQDSVGLSDRDFDQIAGKTAAELFGRS
eukprot:CAMPEP_0185265014 /NCGR_PEP_ID=MMETSP1359-20130426/25982_1 /TAXON_ID=552665 /ORGANISM="Bigelowiella longifila, Strain CCMP242" /LENGTH=331 /DNA_ID=CAMNT_0027854041 /DNA_START=1 /DNA_END=996 /DNA_ORIENTATION=-